jgi:parvulin-like peptidyl-prolyl isomerase
MVNKYLIVQECRRRGLSITRTEVNTEIERMSAHFGVPVDQWLKLLKQERGIKPEQYANDIIWPTLALRKLAGEKLTVTQDELVQVFETEYGPAVRARLIACSTREKAEKLRSAAAASPQQFGNLAKDFSEDAASASAKGLIQPIRKHGNYKEIEQTAFSMADGEVSPVIFAGGQYVIIKREGLLEARKVKLQQISSQLEEMIRDRKMRTLATQIFSQLQKHAVVENVFNDPVKSQQMPGVAALLNGTQITMRQLAEECVERHGEEVLDTMIHRTLLEVACQQQRITVSDKEIDEEIARAADMAVKPLPDGTPDVKTFLTMVTEKQHIPADVYREDVVWPTAAMKKLAGSRITVTEEDLRKGFEANYGPRAKCRAIVMNNLRRAQQVWEMARKTPTLENFGNLAAQYSIEGGSRALQGEVPPIQKNGGQPELEKEAFSLKPGELSGVIQVDDKFVILWCEGYTKPTEVDFAKVRDLIYQDVREKKQQLAMVDYFERLQDMATIDNFLAGTSKTPLRSANLGLPTLHEVPSGK